MPGDAMRRPGYSPRLVRRWSAIGTHCDFTVTFEGHQEVKKPALGQAEWRTNRGHGAPGFGRWSPGSPTPDPSPGPVRRAGRKASRMPGTCPHPAAAAAPRPVPGAASHPMRRVPPGTCPLPGVIRAPVAGAVFIINSMSSVFFAVGVGSRRFRRAAEHKCAVFLVYWCSTHKEYRHHRCFSGNTTALGRCSLVFLGLP